MKGRAACGRVVGEVKGLDPGEEGDTVHPCFTGARYRVVSIEYDGRRIGRLIVGPYLPVTVNAVPPTLLKIDPGVDADRARIAAPEMPRAKEETITRIAQHLKATLDLILFSGHKALLTSTMHLASVTESYRELQEKNATAPGGVRPPEGARSAQIELPRHREPRASHAAHVDHRLQRDARARGSRATCRTSRTSS